MLSDTLCQAKDKAYLGCDYQSNKQHTEQQKKYELCKEYVKNGLTVKVHRPELEKTQKERRNTEIKERVLQIIQKCVS